MNKKNNSQQIIILILLSSIILSGCVSEDKVCFEKKCFLVEKVSSAEEMAKGLMYRTSLDEDKGMLFIFEEEKNHAFWMKNTLIPLDIIWINSSNQITYIYFNATPCKENECPPIIPNSDAIYVLEINAGLSDKYNLKSGDKIKIY